MASEDAERFPCDVCLDWSKAYNEIAEKELYKMKLPPLTPMGLPGNNAHIASARELATARRTHTLFQYRVGLKLLFEEEARHQLWHIALRMSRSKHFREWPVWIGSDADSLANECVQRSKRAWILYALNTWSGARPHYRLREHGLGHKWRRTELIPVLKARNPGVRLIALELMAGAGNGLQKRERT